MKIKKKSILTRSFQCKAPAWILPIYSTVQTTLNSVLSNKTYAKKLININLKYVNKYGKVANKANGTLWKEIQAIIGNPLAGKINNSAWYNRILITNLISLIKSHQQQVIAFDLLKANNFVIDQVLRNQLSAQHLYPTNIELSNLARAEKIPDMPNHSVLKLNYAFADKQMFKMDEIYNCSIQIMSERQAKKQNTSAWRDFKIYIPSYIRTSGLVKICKPVFIYNKNIDKIMCQVPYQLTAEQHPDFTNILGIDLGRVKFYSGTVLYQNGNYSDEFVPSNRLVKLNQKLAELNKHIDHVYSKMQRAKNYKLTINKAKQERRYGDYQNSREKRTRLKKVIEWQVANEVLDIALKHRCKEIHLENLTWVNNIGGKWDFSFIIKHINYLAEIHGIQVKLVDAKNTSKEHPLTKELGKVEKRNINFKDTSVDRDQLAGLNIALRKANHQIKEFYKRKSVQTRCKSRRRKNYLAKKQVLKEKQGKQIVLLSHKIEKHTFSFMLLNKNVSFLDNNLARRNDLRLIKFYNNC